jgi:hypothetical protein
MEEEQPRFKKVEAKKSKMHPGGLKDWVENEKWVDVRRKNKKGKFEPCGRNDTSKGEKPVCVPINKAKNLTEKQIRNRKRQKARKEREPNPGKKPNTTKYTEQAGGKSNVSNNNNIRFIGSMIPLSELRPTQNNLPKFIKISGLEDGDYSDPPFEIPKSPEQQLAEINKQEILLENNNDPKIGKALNYIDSLLIGMINSIPNKETQDALSSIQLGENPRFDDYYFKMIMHAIKTLEKTEDYSTLDENLKQKIEREYLPKVAVEMNIFHKNNHFEYLKQMNKYVKEYYRIQDEKRKKYERMKSILRN